MVQPVHARAVWCTYGAAINASSLYNGARAGSQRVSTYCNAFGLSGWKQIDPASERFSSSFHRTEAENGYEEGEREREREKLAPKRRENGGESMKRARCEVEDLHLSKITMPPQYSQPQFITPRGHRDQ